MSENEVTQPDSPGLAYPPPAGPIQEAPTEVQPAPPPPAPSPPPPAATPPAPAAAAQPAPAAAPAAAPQAPPPTPSLLDRAKLDDQEALATMFAQFLPAGEEVVQSNYLGVLGIWGLGSHSFAAVTPRRFATLRISLLGGVQYQDGSLEYINSASVFQPSKITLYAYAALISVVCFVWGLTVSVALGFVGLVFSLVILPLTVRIYYRFKKSGVLLSVREGLHVYAFIDRKRMRLANQLYRLCTDLREERLRAVGRP